VTSDFLARDPALTPRQEFHERLDFRLRLRDLGQLFRCLGEFQSRAIQHAKGVANIAHLFRCKAAASQSNFVDDPRFGRPAIGDEDSNNFSEIVQDENAETPYEQLEDKTVTNMLQDMVTKLDPREATILRFRFGLDGGTEKTLEEVGVKFNVTRERVRQIQNIALRKLRKMIERLEATRK